MLSINSVQFNCILLQKLLKEILHGYIKKFLEILFRLKDLYLNSD